jgi:protease II
MDYIETMLGENWPLEWDEYGNAKKLDNAKTIAVFTSSSTGL